MSTFRTRRTSICLIGVAILSAAALAWGQEPELALVRTGERDWPQWRGPQRDGVSDETGLLSSWPADGPPRRWTAAGIGRGYSSPIVARETIYVTGDEQHDLVITALSLDGEVRWQVKNGAAWEGSYPGSRSSCTYNQGKLYHMNAHGRIVCLDAETGKETWAVNVLERFAGENIHWGLSESLLVVDDLVLATPCGAQGLVVALYKHSGDTVWTTPAVPDERPSYASPLLLRTGDRRLMVNSAAKHAFAVNVATGELCWQLKQLDPSDTISTIPVLAKNELVLTNASRGFGAMFGIRFDDTRAERVWTRQLSISHGSAVGVEGQVYAASSRGEAKGWVSVAAATGAVQVGAELDPGSLIYADGHIYGLTERGRMTLQKPTDDGFEMVGSFQFAQGKDVWAHPVICDGRLYLRFEDTLYCYDIRS
jgi:outer membrane protein assembly factor BamB